jgi:hypothetical protein
MQKRKLPSFVSNLGGGHSPGVDFFLRIRSVFTLADGLRLYGQVLITVVQFLPPANDEKSTEYGR